MKVSLVSLLSAHAVSLSSSSPSSPGFSWQRFNGSVISGCCAPASNSSDQNVTFAGTFDSQSLCEKACASEPSCQSYTYQDSHPYGNPEYKDQCFFRHDSSFNVVTDPDPTQHDGHFSARKCPTTQDGTGPYSPQWCSVTQHPTPSWFNRAKFGIYAHWGPYSVPAFGTEWYSRNMYVNGSSVNKHHVQTYGASFGYKDFIPMFTAEAFNASEWAELYQLAGARYAGPVAEHADGFCMWDSALSDFNAAKMGPKRDIVGELVQEVRKRGMKVVATLHHQWLWAWYPTWDAETDCGNPEYQLTPQHGGLYGPKVPSAKSFNSPCNTTQAFQDYWRDKGLELATKYGPDLIYFDSKVASTIDEAHRLAFLAGYYNDADARMKNGTSTGVVTTYKNNDLEVGAGTLDYERGGNPGIVMAPWQTDDAVSRSSWSWVDPPNLKNATELIGELVDIVSKNGNFLMDVTPHANGTYDSDVRGLLGTIGNWVSTNGQAIFSTVPHAWFGEGPTKIVPGAFHEWPIFTSKDFRFTRAGSALFVVAMAWPESGEYLVTTLNSTAPVAKEITSLTLVGAESTDLKYAVGPNGLMISGLPATPPAGLHDAFVFRAHLSSSLVGFLLFDVPLTPAVRRGEVAQLRWVSGGDETAELTVAYRRIAAGTNAAWTSIETASLNDGAVDWVVAADVNPGMVEVKISVNDEPHIADVTELRIE